jgi:hypothetical protein
LWVLCFYIYFYFFLSLSRLSTLPSSFSHSYSHALHSPSFSCAKIYCSPPQQVVLLLLTQSLSQTSPSPLILPQPVNRLPLPPTHSSTADQPTIPTLHNPKPLQSLTQAPSTITTEIHPNTHKDHKNSNSHTASLTHSPFFPPHPLVPPYLTPQISIATPTAYRYYHQGVAYITFKLLVRY